MSTDPSTAGYDDPLAGSGAPMSSTGAAQVASTGAPEIKSLLGVVVGTLVVAALYFGRDVLIPITLAVMLSFVLSPLVSVLQRLRLWRAPAVILAVLFALGALGLLGTLIGNQAASLTQDAPRYAQTIQTKVDGVQRYTLGRLAAMTSRLSSKQRGGAADTPATVLATPTRVDGQRVVPVKVVGTEASPFEIARTVLAPILGPLETTIIVLIVAIFILLQKEDIRDRFIRLFGSSDLHRTTLAMNDAGERLSRYFLSQLAVNTCFGIVIALGLWLIGVPSSAMWGVLAGLLRFVPYIGSLLAAVAPAVLAAAVDPGWAMTIEVIALFFVVEPLTGYVVEPLLYGHSTGLSPVSVIVSAIFWTWLWGPIGLIMSTPLTLILVVMGRHVKSLEFFDVLLGDRPALTPVETFYQRVLANDPDEALAQAETLLEGRSLTAYYDEVVLAGLKLAVADQARGTIDDQRAANMTRTMQSVIGDLADRAVASDGAGPLRGTVACVAGHGAFDEAVTAMFAQLLGQRGFAIRTISSRQTTRDRIERLDLSDVAVIAISYLELAGSPASLRYLVRRLRARAPQAQVVVGLWPQGEAALVDEGVQRALGADRYAGSLAAAVDAVEAEADAATTAPSEAAPVPA